MIERIGALVIGYLFGLFQTSFFYGKKKGIDIREHGSGNAGTTNTLRTLGTKAGIIVFVCDLLKCFIASFVVRFVFHAEGDMWYLIGIYGAAGAILGHNYPFYLQFRGGKGIACTAGLIGAFHPAFIPVGLLLFFGTFALTHYVSLGSLILYLGLMIQMVVMGQSGALGMTQPHLNELYIITAILMVIAYWKHRENIVRLINGVERKTYLKKKK
ncbi:MAG: glycerol-3-phosphate 1-O-acyltransferase PlsY [Lachnospiraceae bacterium]|nr:glycerol-3-phosphate 1-O-acyltransferase PlsY [Lachnospiraceae bacterium]